MSVGLYSSSPMSCLCRKMDERKGRGKAHVLVVPFPDGQGHVNPILQFSKRLAFKGLEVTVLNVFRNPEATNLNVVSSSVHVVHRSRLPCQGSEPESMQSHMQRLQTSICFHITELVTQHRSSGSPIACVVYDSITPWVLDVVKGLGVSGAPFFTESCAVNAIFYHVHRGWLKIPIDQSPVSLPGLPLLQVSDLPSLISDPQKYAHFLKLMIDQFSNWNKADWIFINTFNSLEQEVIEWMESHTSFKAIGPTVPSIIVDKRLKDDSHYGLDLFKSNGDDREIIKWLDSKECGTVIYVSFGSVTQPAGEQMEELAWGLKASNKYFIWAIKGASETSKLPSNLLEGIKEKGLVVDWCPQVEVLAHKAVGCFLTHCGWNSVLEALSLGVPMVAMPMWADQMTNAKFVEDVWKVGVRVHVKENSIARREQLELCINQVMEGERSVEIRDNASRWKMLAKEAVDEDGTSDKKIEEFVAQLTNPKA